MGLHIILSRIPGKATFLPGHCNCIYMSWSDLSAMKPLKVLLFQIYVYVPYMSFRNPLPILCLTLALYLSLSINVFMLSESQPVIKRKKRPPGAN